MSTRATALLRPLAEKRIPRAVEDIHMLLAHCLECADQLQEDAALTAGLSESLEALTKSVTSAVRQANTTRQTVEARLRVVTNATGTATDSIVAHVDEEHAARVLAARAEAES